MSQVDPNHSDRLLEAIKSELHNCHAQYNQAHLFLTEIFNRLHSTQELIAEYQTSVKIKEEHITQLETELKLKSQQVEAVSFEHEELRRRIKSEKHNSLQYKAALHRCLDTSHRSGEEAHIYSQALKLTHSITNSDNSEELALCSYESLNSTHNSLNIAPLQIDSPQFTQDLITQDPTNHQVTTHQSSVPVSDRASNKSDKSEVSYRGEALYRTDKSIDKSKGEPKTEIGNKEASHKIKPRSEANLAAQSSKDLPVEKSKSFAAIKLPQFAPLKPR